MTEYKTLKELWDEAGEKPFDAVQVHLTDDWFHMVAVSPIGDAIGWDQQGVIAAWTSTSQIWRLAPPKKKMLPHWPAILSMTKGRNRLSTTLYPILGDAMSAWGQEVVRLATEYPAILLEVEE